MACRSAASTVTAFTDVVSGCAAVASGSAVGDDASATRVLPVLIRLVLSAAGDSDELARALPGAAIRGSGGAQALPGVVGGVSAI